MSVLGRPVARLEDPPLVAGKGRFAGDVVFPRQLHMRVVRADRAHGRLVSVDVSEAAAMPGVVAVWTGKDVADLPPIDFRDPAAAALAPYRQPILAQRRVRYVGEPVAAVFAEDAYLAEDAAELVAVEIDDLDVLLDAASAPGEFDPGVATEPLVLKQGYGDRRMCRAGRRCRGRATRPPRAAAPRLRSAMLGIWRTREDSNL